jgi:hypothetical protein
MKFNWYCGVPNVGECSETTLTEESRVSHKYPPPGIEPGSLMTGSKQVDHWTSGLCVKAVRLQALHRAPLQQSTMSVVKPEGGPAASVITGQKS